MSRRLLAAAAGAAAVFALVLAPVGAASAHDYLVSSDPAADATVTTPIDTVALTFNDRVLDLSGDASGTLLTVTGPDAGTRHFETGCPAIADTKVTAPVSLGAAGRYTVTYQIVSADGHTVSNAYAFQYTPPAGTPAASGSEATPCGAASPSPTATTPEPVASTLETSAPAPEATDSVSTPQPSKPADTGNVGLVIGIAIAIVVLAVAGVIVVILTARRRPKALEAPEEGEREPDDKE